MVHNDLYRASDWVKHWTTLIPTGGKILDLACGNGRHAIYLANLGYRVDAVDRDFSLLENLKDQHGITATEYDLESNRWPFQAGSYEGVVVTNYLHRPLFSHLVSAVKSSGVLIYETFSAGNEKFGKPSNPDFLLWPGELLEVVRDKFRVIAYEDIYLSLPKPAMVQRICAVKL